MRRHAGLTPGGGRTRHRDVIDVLRRRESCKAGQGCGSVAVRLACRKVACAEQARRLGGGLEQQALLPLEAGAGKGHWVVSACAPHP